MYRCLALQETQAQSPTRCSAGRNSCDVWLTFFLLFLSHLLFKFLFEYSHSYYFFAKFHPGANTDFVGPKAFTKVGALFEKKKINFKR